MDLPYLRLQARKVLARRYFSRLDLMREDAPWMEREGVAMVMAVEGLVLCGPHSKRTHDVAVSVPASWWQHFKLTAIEWGNPFFDPTKVRMREIRRRVVFTYAELMIDPPLIPQRDEERGFIEMSMEEIP